MQALFRTANNAPSNVSELAIADAIAYARAHQLHALAIERAGELLASEYGEDFGPEKAHALYSGTKSFWGAAALFAQTDGLLHLDEPVADTFASWRDDPWKRRVTLRMLLSLTAGFGFGGLGAAVPPYDRALELPLRDEPGTRFTYGGVPFQVFGAVFARRLATSGRTPHDYLAERVLAPAKAAVAAWRTLPDGTHPLPTGASMRAAGWLAYGRWVMRERVILRECFEGSAANKRYGLGWWLGAKHAPDDLVYASGSAGQALYLVPSLELAVVHFGRSRSYRHDVFLKRLFGGARSREGRAPRTP